MEENGAEMVEKSKQEGGCIGKYWYKFYPAIVNVAIVQKQIGIKRLYQ